MEARTGSQMACPYCLYPLLQHHPIFPSPHILQIYNQTDGSYMGSPEMSPLYSIVNALTQTAATIILILASPFSFSLVFSLFLSSCLPSSLDQSLFLPFRLSASYPVSVSQRTNVPPHTHTNSLSLESNSGTLKHLRSLLFFAFLIMHIILPLLVNCTK